MRSRLSLLAMAAAALAIAAAHPASAGTVAITVDDLPIYANDFPPRAEAQRITDDLLAGFKRHGWPVTGFVIASELAGRHRASRTHLLEQWLDAGYDLGNHTYSHASLSITSVDKFIRDAERGDRVVRRLMRQRGKSERWFRYPYLQTGTTVKVRQQFAAWLVARGLRSAPVTMQNLDWEFAEPYDDALARGASAEAAAIRASYLQFTVEILAWYRSAASQVLGREPAQILLIHANRLNAASIDALSAILDQAGLTPVSLDTALTDPAYRIPDTYVGDQGLDWIQRWALTLGKRVSSTTQPQVPADIAAAYQRIQEADPDPGAPVPVAATRP